MGQKAGAILITVEKFRVGTHHNALRFSTVSHITVGLAQARSNQVMQNYFFYTMTCGHRK